MIPQDEWEHEKGYGIGSQMYVDVNILVCINTVTQHIKIYSAEDKKYHYDSSFDDFVTSYSKNASF
jgi:hypothetical protein